MTTPDVVVDTAKCQGHGRCNILVPEVFDVDDLGTAIVLVERVPPELRKGVEEAVYSCPEMAITFTGGD